MKYKVWVRLEEYEDIEADNEEAFITASEYAISGGNWQYVVKSMDIEPFEER